MNRMFMCCKIFHLPYAQQLTTWADFISIYYRAPRLSFLAVPFLTNVWSIFKCKLISLSSVNFLNGRDAKSLSQFCQESEKQFRELKIALGDDRNFCSELLSLLDISEEVFDGVFSTLKHNFCFITSHTNIPLLRWAQVPTYWTM